MLSYSTYGAGLEKVLLIHGYGIGGSTFNPLFPYLNAQKYTYIIPDLRGYGRSRDLKGYYCSNEACEDLIDLINTLKVEKLHLLGFSMGGKIAQFLTSNIPEKVKSLVLLSTSMPGPLELTPEEKQNLVKTCNNYHGEVAQLFHMMTSNRLSDYIIEKKVTMWSQSSSPDVRQGYSKIFTEENISEDIKGIKNPILILAGEHDMPEMRASVYKESLLPIYPQAELMEIPNAGHFAADESPAYLATVIEGFFAKHE